jgi:hypothetical protein
MTWAAVVSLHTTIVHALHSFVILEARSPCCVIASHGYIVFCGLIALHGFAGWLRSSASQVAPFCLCPWSDCYISSTYSTFVFFHPSPSHWWVSLEVVTCTRFPNSPLVSMLLRYINCIIGHWQGTCYARTRGLETQVLWECIRGFVRLSLNLNNTRFAPCLPCTIRSDDNVQFPRDLNTPCLQQCAIFKRAGKTTEFGGRVSQSAPQTCMSSHRRPCKMHDLQI